MGKRVVLKKEYLVMIKYNNLWIDEMHGDNISHRNLIWKEYVFLGCER